MDRFILAIFCLSLCAAGAGHAQGRITNLSLKEAVTLAARENFALRTAPFDHQATRADEITGGLIPDSCLEILYQLELAVAGSPIK